MFILGNKKNRSKGVSEIVATVLMIAIVAAAGTGILLYSTGYFSGITSARDQADAQNLNSLREHFIITDASVKNASGIGTVNASIYNFGETNVKIVGMYVNGMNFSLSSPIQINPNQSKWVNATGAGIPGNLIYIKVRVVSSLGNYYEEYFAPE